MGKIQEITSLLNKYRECSRNLWNVYLYPSDVEHVWDVRDRFEEVDKLLFSILVLEKLGLSETYKRVDDESVEFIKIVPSADSGVPIMINRPSQDGNKYWDDPVDRVGTSEVDLRFIRYFDWDSYGFADFKYYLTRIVSFPKHPHLEGRDALIETSYVKAFFLPRDSGSGQGRAGTGQITT